MIVPGRATAQSARKDPLDPASHAGLSEAEAEARLRTEGYNELPSSKHQSFLAIVLGVVREPMLLLLLACAGIYVVLGDVREALTLSIFVVIIIGIAVYQERKTERSLEALRDLSSPRALVIRDGKQRRVPGREVARGDLIVLVEGDRVPADAIVLGASNLQTDESLLTGESVPVRKIAAKSELSVMERPGGDDRPFVYSGTLAVRGRGLGRVIETGHRTELGRIGKALASVEPGATRVEREVRRMVRAAFVVAIVLCALVVVVYALTRGDLLRGFLAGLTLAMAMLPEEFPVVLAIFLALGAYRMSKRRVLTRRPSAVEMLGSATVLCVDKTGTLTQNRMAIRALSVQGERCDIERIGEDELAETFHELVEFGILASQRDPFDPMEVAFHALGKRKLEGTEHLHADWELVREYPLSPELLALSHVWRSPGGDRFVIAAKGAPEAIADLCHLEPERVEELRAEVTALAEQGLRVLGVARAYFRGPNLPGEQHDFDFELLGLVALADPVRPGVAEAIEDCRRAGIRVVMITGDYPGTARAIARQIGLAESDCVTGPELDAMSDAELGKRAARATIFARVVPEQKLRLVQALMARGEVVAMTGDGVNDAPALKAAHIGVAMGGRGTDVAREASALVVTDDDFTSLVAAVRMGRRVFDNLKKAIAYIVAIHVPIAGMSLIPVVLGWPLVLLPAHVLFMEMVIDPACSVAFEAEPDEADLMRRPPRPPEARLFGLRELIASLLQGAGVLAIAALVYRSALGGSEERARALAFSTLLISNWALILTNRSWSRSIFATLRTPNRAAWWVIGGAAVVLGLVLFVPALRDLFRFAPLSAEEIGLSAAAGLGSVIWLELSKRFLVRPRADAHRPIQ
ncbi:MAG: cation-translocating P-type ATPase [Polyangiaceae bacterium]|nr:cation-translocating P-type ATPase [Polyangiaceae bacterium]